MMVPGVFVDHAALVRNVFEAKREERLKAQGDAGGGGPVRELTWLITDWHSSLGESRNHPGTPADFSDLSWQAAMHLIGQGRVVVTNRLHATVTAQLLHVPCFWFDGTTYQGYGKVRSTTGFAHSLSPSTCTPDNLLSYVIQGPDETAQLADAVARAIDMVEQLDAVGSRHS